MQASAGFVSASALGMACGPALAGILQINFKISKLTFNQNTLPGWVMAVAWLIYLVWLWITFKEPAREAEEDHTPHQSNDGTELILHLLVTYCLRLKVFGSLCFWLKFSKNHESVYRTDY